MGVPEGTFAGASTQLSLHTVTAPYASEMIGHYVQCVEQYCGITGTKVAGLPQVATSYIDDNQLLSACVEEKGWLASHAARCPNTMVRCVTWGDLTCDGRVVF